jgi:hypothetical protein
MIPYASRLVDQREDCPLTPRPRLLHTYTSRLDDSLRTCDKPWPKASFISVMKNMVRDKVTSLDARGFPPFRKGNDHFAVSHKSLLAASRNTICTC